MGSEDVKVARSSENVFKDLGFPDAEAERALFVLTLCVSTHL